MTSPGAVAYGAYSLAGPTTRGPADLIKTPGVSNIEKRFSSGGGGTEHTPGAATPRGNLEDTKGRNEGSNGWGDKKFRDQAGDMMGG